MSQNAVLTQGTTLQRGDGATPEVFTTIPDVLTIAGPTATKREIDVTDLASLAMEFKGGLADFGTFTVELNYIPGNPVHTALRNDFNNSASPVHNFKLNFVNGHYWTFAAYVSGLPGNTQANSVQKSAMTLRCTGQVLET
jgi:hypothetical protein